MTFGLHLTLGFTHSKVAFGLSSSQSDSWNFSSFNYNNSENMKTLHIPHFCIFHVHVILTTHEMKASYLINVLGPNQVLNPLIN